MPKTEIFKLSKVFQSRAIQHQVQAEFKRVLIF